MEVDKSAMSGLNLLDTCRRSGIPHSMFVDISNVRPVIQSRFAKRLVSFILFSVIAMASSAPSAFAADDAFGRASLSSAICPAYEGYPDCHPDADVKLGIDPRSVTAKASGTLVLSAPPLWRKGRAHRQIQ